jgi:hypothetical protein
MKFNHRADREAFPGRLPDAGIDSDDSLLRCLRPQQNTVEPVELLLPYPQAEAIAQRCKIGLARNPELIQQQPGKLRRRPHFSPSSQSLVQLFSKRIDIVLVLFATARYPGQTKATDGLGGWGRYPDSGRV